MRLAVRAILSLRRPALVVAPSGRAARAWSEAIARAYPGKVASLDAGEVEPISVATAAGARRALEALGDHFDILVVDGAERPGGEAIEAAQEACAPLRLGLAGSPPEPGSPSERLADLLGPVCSAPPPSRAARTESGIEVRALSLRLSPEERLAYDRERSRLLRHLRPFFRSRPQAAWRDFVRVASRSAGGREALGALRRSREILALSRAKLLAVDRLLDLHRDVPAFVVAPGSRSALEISRRLLVPAVVAGIGPEERAAILGRFRDGACRAIAWSGIPGETAEVPAFRLAILTGGSLASLKGAERVGRLLRPLEGKRRVAYALIAAGTGERLGPEKGPERRR